MAPLLLLLAQAFATKTPVCFLCLKVGPDSKTEVQKICYRLPTLLKNTTYSSHEQLHPKGIY